MRLLWLETRVDSKRHGLVLTHIPHSIDNDVSGLSRSDNQ